VFILELILKIRRVFFREVRGRGRIERALPKRKKGTRDNLGRI
jgi:hypothetical protein